MQKSVIPPPHSLPGKYLHWYEQRLVLQYWVYSSLGPDKQI